ncbi:sensor histidine kinase [Kitasatospora cathayae]|uniref:histidine kinase n=1 Tax=Kitasatospora cathayae TaxID=3004092 RepID=A0ABY7QGV9_9ACTN|nr:sensor histidine kinase [Kitasatospora sp. HUAS 3-15]WBP91660.1 sensor histidine kinase [Kitasatospora sp. HUAS 3-15]
MTQWYATATGVLAVLALVAAARYRAVSVTQRGRADALEGELARLQEQLAAELSRRGADLAAVQQEQELTASTQRAFLSVARRILVMAHDQQALLDEMERTHDDPALLEGLLKADHAAAQQARLAQTLAVLCGARAGRHWPEPVSLEDVVRGAQSRILPFQRVVVRSRIETAVVGAAAEALIHAVAELLDNATRYSPPSTQVFVTLMPVHNGAVIEIDDGGVGMPEQAVAKAAAALAGGSSLEVSRLGEVPQLGLAAVGRLAESYGFRVTLSSAPSPYGGVRVVVLLPNALLTEPLPPTVPGLGVGPGAGLGHGLGLGGNDRPFDPERVFDPDPRPTAGSAHPVAGHPGAGHPLVEPPPTGTPTGPPPATGGTPPPLPRRSHRRDRAKGPQHAAPPPPEPPYRSARDAQAFMAMFQAGTANGRSAARAQGQPPGPH